MKKRFFSSKVWHMGCFAVLLLLCSFLLLPQMAEAKDVYKSVNIQKTTPKKVYQMILKYGAKGYSSKKQITTYICLKSKGKKAGKNLTDFEKKLQKCALYQGVDVTRMSESLDSGMYKEGKYWKLELNASLHYDFNKYIEYKFKRDRPERFNKMLSDQKVDLLVDNCGGWSFKTSNTSKYRSIFSYAAHGNRLTGVCEDLKNYSYRICQMLLCVKATYSLSSPAYGSGWTKIRGKKVPNSHASLLIEVYDPEFKKYYGTDYEILSSNNAHVREGINWNCHGAWGGFRVGGYYGTQKTAVAKKLIKTQIKPVMSGYMKWQKVTGYSIKKGEISETASWLRLYTDALYTYWCGDGPNPGTKKEFLDLMAAGGTYLSYEEQAQKEAEDKAYEERQAAQERERRIDEWNTILDLNGFDENGNRNLYSSIYSVDVQGRLIGYYLYIVYDPHLDADDPYCDYKVVLILEGEESLNTAVQNPIAVLETGRMTETSSVSDVYSRFGYHVCHMETLKEMYPQIPDSCLSADVTS